MRGFAVDAFGERGSVRELPTPELGEGEVLVRVKAASVNAFDWAVVQGFAKDYMEHRFPLTPGTDVSGVVEAVGPDVDAVAAGDEVYGVSEKPFQGAGSFAQFLVTPSVAVAPKPSSVDHVGAATLPLAGLTALSAVEAVDPRESQVVLVTGATGGVGSFATQLLTNRRARVLAVAREENAEYARSLGADDTVDYTKGDLVELVRGRYPDGVDAVVDNTGDADLVARLVMLVRPGGAVVSVAGGVDVEAVGPELRGANVSRAPLERLAELTRMVDAGQVRVPATKTFSLHEAATALEEQGTRHVRGKLVLQID
jgi:NADPH:quinone reductase-like Zn-dependent oxidoreductase